MESPKATITRVSAGIIMSTASRKNHDAVEYGNADSSSDAPFAPARLLRFRDRGSAVGHDRQTLNISVCKAQGIGLGKQAV